MKIIFLVLMFSSFVCGKNGTEDVPPPPEMLKNYENIKKDSLPIPSGAITLHYQIFFDMEIVKWQLGDEVFFNNF